MGKRATWASKPNASTTRNALCRVVIDTLETRRLLAAITVNSTADTNTRDANLTLREAIQLIDGTLAYSSLSTQEQAQVNLTQPLGTNDTIKFNIFGLGLQTFYPTSQLPAITKAVTIDGYSEPGAAAATSSVAANFHVAIDGVYAGNVPGLMVEAPNVTIDGLLIYRFTGASGDGIDLATGSGSDSVWGNYLGTDGTRSLGNNVGVQVDSGSTHDTIGGTDAAHRNVISANAADGINIAGGTTEDSVYSRTTIEGNFIGTNSTGQSAVGNKNGIQVTDGVYDTIGGTTAGARNIISGNSSYGAQIDLADEDVFEGNYVGTDVSGTKAVPNSLDGVHLDESSDVTIGGTAAGAGNLLSGNTYDGLYLYDSYSPMVEGNLIGTDVTGKTALANNSDGIYESYYSTGGVIGGTTAAARNIISGNGGNGVEAYQADAFYVEGNYIGLDVTGENALGNKLDGVVFEHRGGISGVYSNVISGNGGNGIDLTSGVNSMYLTGNYIGTDPIGGTAIPNSGDGVKIQDGATQVDVGEAVSGGGNVICGNLLNGVEIEGDAFSDTTYGNTASVTVQNNYIGLSTTGSTALGNGYVPHNGGITANGSGVVIAGAAQNNTIGGTSAYTRNVISGNGYFNVQIDGTQSFTQDTTNNIVEGNYIGTDVSGRSAVGSSYGGVYIDQGAENNTVGGTASGAGNVVVGSSNGAAIWIDGNGSSGGAGGGPLAFTTANTVEGNDIGTDVTGTAIPTYPTPSGSSSGGIYAPYFGVGVYLSEDAYDNTIGGTTAAARNIISGNLSYGINIDSAHDNTVEGNYVGVDVTGSKALGNVRDGIIVSGNGNTIGGSSAGAGNVISGNGTTSGTYDDNGIQIDGADQTVVQGNEIGTDATGASAIGNLGNGILIDYSGADNTIGGSLAADQNIIANNGLAGIAIQILGPSGGGTDAGYAVGNAIRLNSIFGNKGLGIDLNNDGVTPNDPKDVDTGPNDLQNFPILATAAATASSVTITGNFNSVPSTTFILDFYASPTVDSHGNGQGKLYVGSATVTTDANGNATINSTFNTAIGSNSYITSTATNQSTAPYGDTSEFSAPIIATGNTAVAPAIKAFTVDNGTTQRSRIRTLTLTFTEPVTLDSSAITLTKTSGTSTGNVTYTTSTPDSGTTYVITPTSNTTGASLTDGKYSLAVTPTGVHSSASPTTTMTGSTVTYTFFRLFGDSNGDGTVNLVDYRAFAATYLKSSGTTGYNAIFDSNNDNTINLVDYRAFASNYLKSIAM